PRLPSSPCGDHGAGSPMGKVKLARLDRLIRNPGRSVACLDSAGGTAFRKSFVRRGSRVGPRRVAPCGPPPKASVWLPCLNLGAISGGLEVGARSGRLGRDVTPALDDRRVDEVVAQVGNVFEED